MSKFYEVPNIPPALTGIVKYRLDFFGHVVLQVQEERIVRTKQAAWNPGKDVQVSIARYRDATLKDLEHLNLFDRSPSRIAKRFLKMDADSILTGEVFFAKAFFSNKVVLLVEELKHSFPMSTHTSRYAGREDFTPKFFEDIESLQKSY